MEILCITHKYPPFVGGMEKQSFELISALKKDNIVHTICYTGEKGSKLGFFRKLKTRVKKVLSENPNIQIIHLNDGLMALVSTWLKSITNIPVIVTFHGLDLVFPNSIYQKRIKNRISKFDGFICVSSATAKECQSRNIEKSRTFVVPNGVDHEIAQHNSLKEDTLVKIKAEYALDLSNKHIICTVGRPVKRKGFSWFLNNIIPELSNDTYLIMIGAFKVPQKKWFHYLMPPKVLEQFKLMQGGLSDEMEIHNWKQTSTFSNRVLQTGKIPLDFLLNILQAADIFVMPNIKMPGDAEGFGLVALEASISSTTVIASELEGITEAIKDNKNGYLLPSKDKNAWVNKIHSVLNNKEIEETKAEEFKNYTLENYSWEKMTKGYIDVFAKILSR